MEPVCDQGTQVNGQIVIESVSSNLSNEAAAVLIDASKRKIQFIDKDSLVVKYPFNFYRKLERHEFNMKHFQD